LGGSRKRDRHLLTTGDAEGGLSTKLPDLVEGYELLRSTSQQDPLYAENGRTVLLYDRHSIRIYLTRELQTWRDISLEVEVFLSTPEETETASMTKEGGSGRLLLRLSRYLDYLLRLKQEGFMLDPVAGDCVWTAKRALESKPNTQLYKIVSPPED
jgi:hypothetical protein